MRRRFNNHNINQLGYTDNTNTMYNNFNTIPGNNITMQNTSFPVVGQGLDQFGNPITQPVTMQPGQDYQFGNVSFVQETPQLQGGGTYNVPTYYPPAPSVANNFNQPYGINEWNRAYLTGQGQPLQQEPTVVQQGLIDSNYPEVVTPQEDIEVSQNNNQGTFQFYNPYGGYSVENASFQLGQGIQEGNTLQTVGAGLKMLTGLGRNVMSGMGYQNRNNQIMEEYRRQQRNAMTQQNRPQMLQEGGEVQMSQEEQLIQGVVQALQEGISPEEVLQALVQQGLDEATATELIQGIMQQMQAPQQEVMKRGGEYLSKMKGKKIKNYTYNSKTGNYDVEFE